MKEIVLINNKGITRFSDIDLEKVSKYNWRLEESKGRKYAATGFGPTHMFMHELIMGASGIDHKDNDGLNNERENLRKATQSQNMANRGKQKNNTSGFKGVFMEKNGTWFAKIAVNRKQMRLGTFKTKEEAARSYDKWARHYFGEFACTNYPLPEPTHQSPPSHDGSSLPIPQTYLHLPLEVSPNPPVSQT